MLKDLTYTKGTHLQVLESMWDAGGEMGKTSRTFPIVEALCTYWYQQSTQGYSSKQG